MNDAPAKISMIMAVRRVEPMTLAQSESQVSDPDHQAMASDPVTPQAAHSVAVAQPNRSEAKTSAMSKRQGMRLADARSLARKLMGGSRGGCLAGFRSAQTMM